MIIRGGCMSFASLFLSLLLGFIGALAILTAFILYLYNRYKVQQQHKILGQKIHQFRLYKMLLYLGVNFDHYIRGLPRETILNHASNCSVCPNTPTCDKCISGGKIISNMNFCPNYQSLIKYSPKLAQIE